MSHNGAKMQELCWKHDLDGNFVNTANYFQFKINEFVIKSKPEKAG
jgi:hypothetical protein